MAIGYVGRVLRRAGRERARTTEGFPLQCYGCGRANGTLERLPFRKADRKTLYAHRSGACRGPALRRFLEERDLIATPSLVEQKATAAYQEAGS